MVSRTSKVPKNSSNSSSTFGPPSDAEEATDPDLVEAWHRRKLVGLRRWTLGPGTSDFGPTISKSGLDSASNSGPTIAGKLGFAGEGEGEEGSSFAGSGVPLICGSILLVELCERIAYYSITGTQESFLERYGYSLTEASALTATMGTLGMLWALLSGWLADVCLGRYRSIIVFAVIYILGCCTLAIAAWPSHSSTGLYLFGVMVLVPLGTAGIKANISNFGADQFDISQPGQEEAQEQFFSWFYIAINLGAGVAYGCLTTLGSNGGLGLSLEHGYFAVYAIAAACMVGALVAFIGGSAAYRVQALQPRSSAVAVIEALAHSCVRGAGGAWAVSGGLFLLLYAVVLSVIESFLPHGHPWQQSCTLVAFMTSGLGTFLVTYPCLRPSWMSAAALSPTHHEGTSAADVRNFLRLLPVLFSGNLAFNALYNSMQYWYQQQACQMDLRMPWTTSGAQFAGSFFLVADCLAILAATPLALRFINPQVEKFCGDFGHGAKFGLGMLFASLSVVVASRLELQRAASPLLPQFSQCAPDGVRMSDLNAAWMLIPYFLMGVGEIYTQPVLMHLAYIVSPPSLRALSMAASLVVGAVSTSLFTAQVSASSAFVPDNLNDGHLEYGYYLNLAIGLGFYCCFVHALRCLQLRPNDLYA